METDLVAKFEKQDDLRNLLSRIEENFRKLAIAKRTRGNIKGRLERLDSYWEKFCSNHEEISIYKKNHPEHPYFSNDLYSSCEEEYLNAKGTFLDLLENMTSSTSTASIAPSNQNLHQNVIHSRKHHLPQINLPKFDGNYANWAQFHDLFQSMINENLEISDVEKFHYLKMSLVNEPAQLLKNIVVTNENYERAWNLLIDRFENRRLLIDSHISNLISCRPLKNDSSTELKRLLAEIKEALGALATLHCPVNEWDYLIVFLVVRKLDMETIKDWEKSLSNSREPACFQDLESYLISRVHALEAIEQLNPQKSSSNSSKAVTFNLKSHNTSVYSCYLCKGAHYISSCQEYCDKSPKDRLYFVTSKKLCFNCIGPHLKKDCKSSKRCQICKKGHHTSLHEVQVSTVAKKNNPQSSSETLTIKPVTTNSSFIHSHHMHAPVLLATAMIKINSSFNERHTVRALIDQGSEVSFISEALVQKLKLPRRSGRIPISGVGSQHMNTSNGIVSIQLISPINESCTYNEEALILPKLTSYLPQKTSTKIDFEFGSLILADPDFTSQKRIDLILGVNLYSKILQNGVKKGKNGLLAQETSLGWIISGALPSSDASQRSIYGFQCSIDSQMLEIMEKFWRQEECQPQNPCLSIEERECEEHFTKTHQRNAEGRFIVKLPFRKPPSDLGESYNSALRILNHIEYRFIKNQNLKKEYYKFMNEYLDLGHMKLSSSDLNQPHFYLPHHGVIRESSTTTKLRVVFNGSQKTSSGLSLNECLHIGPKLQTELFDVLLRWRRHPVVFVCDLEKMYRQILVNPEDWRFQQILWKDSSDKVQTYQLQTVTYGLSCAPFLAIRCLRELAKQHLLSQPLGSIILLNDTYVDDILSGAESVDDAQEMIFQLNQVLTAGGFHARKWMSNISETLDQLPTNDVSNTRTVNIHEDNAPKALGLIWYNETDHLYFILDKKEDNKDRFTKRKVLSFIARLYDPLGLLSPFIIIAKIFMQELWTRKLEWDEDLPEDLVKKWITFQQDFLNVPAIQVPRWIGFNRNAILIELHGFADASVHAFGAVIYLRVKNLDNIRVSLITSKTKVAPLKNLSIPRLELCATVLLVRLIKRVSIALELKNQPIHLWTDSTVVLSWICSHPSRWKDFVRNRVIEIQDLSEARWSYVPSQENPADLASRGVPARHLQDESLWWSGPSWLSLSSDHWPTLRPVTSSEVNQEEKRLTITVHSVSVSGWDLKLKYSSLNKLLRVTAWCFRFIKKTNINSVSETLSVNEINDSLMFWVHESQQTQFQTELRDLRDGKVLSKSSSLYRLTPFIDGNGILRITGRLRFALLDWDEKHPIILPKDSQITSLIIDSHHRKTLHGGTQLTLASIRRRFWIIGGRAPVRSFILRCFVCARQRVEASQQLMGQLPPCRVIPSRPFLHTGVDYAGPFQLKTFRGRRCKTYKSYMILFICLATSAIHLEVATDYSTAGFISAYKRFTGRRGLCQCMYSDCGTNLVGADRELRSLFSAASKDWSHVINVLSSDGTKWKFNPPAAPHFGGKWEAGVRSVKTHLRKVIGTSLLTYEEFTTVLIEIEAVLNSRPLCSVSDDPNNYDVLTPAHFLIGSSLSVIPEPSLLDENVSRLSRYQFLRRIVEEFWKKWEKFYLQSIQNSTKWFEGRRIPDVGSLVLIKDERLPPAKWLLARVLELHPGGDGRPRISTVKTSTTTLVRPITKLCLLPT